MTVDLANVDYLIRSSGNPRKTVGFGLVVLVCPLAAFRSSEGNTSQKNIYLLRGAGMEGATPRPTLHRRTAFLSVTFTAHI